jgi:hypothetical protein
MVVKIWEYMIRRASVYTDRIEWLPASHDPSFEAISVPSTGVGTEVLGLVYAAYWPRMIGKSPLQS